MKATPSVFVRAVDHYPDRYLPDPVVDAHFQRRMEIRPARFAMGLEAPKTKQPSGRGLRVHELRFVGRVDEVSEDGIVSAILWEQPSGRASIATLDVGEHFQGDRPGSGDLLDITTWVELVGPEKRSRAAVNRHSKTLSEAEREGLRVLLEEIKAGVE